jgi:hypothetical protein
MLCRQGDMMIGCWLVLAVVFVVPASCRWTWRLTWCWLEWSHTTTLRLADGDLHVHRGGQCSVYHMTWARRRGG